MSLPSPYLLFTLYLPLILLFLFASSKLISCPPCLYVFIHDVVSPEDIEELEQKDEERIRLEEVDQKRQAARGRETTQDGGLQASSPEADEATPLLLPSSRRYVSPDSPSLQQHRWKLVVLTAIAIAQGGGWLSAAMYDLESRRPFPGLVLITQLLTWTYMALRAATRRKQTPPYDLLVLYSVQCLAAIIGIHEQWAYDDEPVFDGSGIAQIFASLASLVAIGLIFSLPLTEHRRAPLPDATNRPPAAEDHCTLWEWMSFSWMTPMIKLASQRTLDKPDVWRLSTSMRSSLLSAKFKRVQASSLPWKVIKANKHDMVLDLSLTLLSSILAYASPYFLKQILSSIEASTSPHPPANAIPKATAYLFALFSLVASILKSQADLQHLFYGRRANVRIRAQLIGSIYDKALRTKDMNGVLGAGGNGSASSASPDEKKSKKKDSLEIETTQAKKGPAPSSSPAEPSASRNDASIGKIVSLAAVDAMRISQQVAGAYMLYSAPFEIVIASVFLYQLLGWSAFSGFLVLIVASPIQSALTRRMIAISKALSTARDQRLNALSEMTSQLRFIKYYALEHQFQKRVLEYRQQELLWLRKRQLTQAAITGLWTGVPAMVTTIAFSSYVLIAKQDLDVATAFTSIALFQLLKGPLNNLPMQINELLNAKVSADRIEDFLAADEVRADVSTLNDKDGLTSVSSTPSFESPSSTASSSSSLAPIIGIEAADFKWPSTPVSNLAGQGKEKKDNMIRRIALKLFRRGPEANMDPSVKGDDIESRQPLLSSQDDAVSDRPFQLSGITFLPPAGKMTLVLGATGSGKSALLTALLGELDLITGQSHLHKSPRIDPKTGLSDTIAYCAQASWLQHASIRANILFGQPYEKARYEAVLDACALRPDLKILDGDGTEIGEKGVSLSGGQQARVALARAVYSRAATLLLDDPLSAVDSHTAVKLVKDCLGGPLMKGRTVVLVTHHVDLVLATRDGEKAKVEWVVKMSEGRIVRQGTPAQLQASGDLETEHEESTDQEGDSSASSSSEEQVEAKADEVVDGSSAPATLSGTATPRPADQPRRLVDEEKRAQGGVKKEVYKMYLGAVGSQAVICVIISLILFKGTDLAEKAWLAVWGGSESQREKSLQSLAYLAHSSDFKLLALTGPIKSAAPDLSASSLPPASVSPLPYILVFFAIQVASAITIVASAIFSFNGSLQGSRRLFASMLTATMGATSRWLDKTPSGRIVNKFSRDVEVIDGAIVNSLRYFVGFVISAVIAVLTIVFLLPSFLIPAILLGWLNWHVAKGYIRAARDLRRLESVSRSPIFSAFSELLQGISTARAFAAESRLLRECTDRIDLANSFFLYFWMSNRYLLVRLDVLSAAAIFIATLASLWGGIPSGQAGLALTQCQGLCQALYWLSRMWTNLEQDANSIERIREALEETPQEFTAPKDANATPPPEKWPTNGEIQVKDLVLRYAPDLPIVLNKVSFTVSPGEKVGIVGRTGSGKSTTALAFFRFVDFDSGSILIDGVDIAQEVDLHTLRSKLTIIPQNAVLFSGTIRENLDPWVEHTDEECERALHSVSIRTISASQSVSRAQSVYDVSSGGEEDDEEEEAPLPLSQTYLTLDSKVSEGGLNFSSGQRQLLSIARALLRKSRVILMDEASSSIDLATDHLIQSTLRKGFKDATVLTIAHRLATVAAGDQVLVLDQGKVVEFGRPRNLLMKEGSLFYQMCAKSGDLAKLQRLAGVVE